MPQSQPFRKELKPVWLQSPELIARHQKASLSPPTRDKSVEVEVTLWRGLRSQEVQRLVVEGLKRAGSGSHDREKGREPGKDACGDGPLPVSLWFEWWGVWMWGDGEEGPAGGQCLEIRMHMAELGGRQADWLGWVTVSYQRDFKRKS